MFCENRLFYIVDETPVEVSKLIPSQYFCPERNLTRLKLVESDDLIVQGCVWSECL